MDGSAFFKMCEQFGLGVALSFAILVMFFFILKWTMKQQDNILKLAESRDVAWREVTNNLKSSIDKQILDSTFTSNTVAEAHRYQREEHKDLMEQMREVTASLGRINGYKR